MLDISTIGPTLGSSHDSDSVKHLLESIGAGDPQIATFPDGLFHNYPATGVSFFYISEGSRLDRVDFYNPSTSTEPSRKRRKPTQYAPAPELVFNFPTTTLPIPPPLPNPNKPAAAKSSSISHPTSIERPARLIVTGKTTAKELVECFGEPSKKGGMTAWIETYMEWEVEVLDTAGQVVKLGILVELREGGGEGMDVWDRAQQWEWACLKVFKV